MISSAPSVVPLPNPGLHTTPPQWHDIFLNPVEDNDPLWKQYVEEAALFDNRMIDEWNKIIDVVLVYAALFSAVLTSFAIQTSSQLQPDPAHISNQLLIAIYKNQLAALQNNSPSIINATDLFQLDPGDYQDAVVANAILFTGLSLAVMASVVALFAKLWVTTYNDRVNSAGSLYERAKRRQEAYSGALAWRLGTVINVLPSLLLVAVVTFGYYIAQATGPKHGAASVAAWLTFNLGLYFIVLVSIAAAFIPACPFHSLLSTVLKLPFKLWTWVVAKLLKYSRGRFAGVVQGPAVALMLAAFLFSVMVMVIFKFNYYHYMGFFLFTCVAALGFSSLEDVPRADKRPEYGVHQWLLCGTPFMATVLVGSLLDAPKAFFYVLLFASFSLAITWVSYGLRMIRFVPDTWEADALMWLLKSTSSLEPSFFTKAGQIAEGSEHRKALLLTPLLPILSPLIISLNRPEGEDESFEQTLKVYVACLAQLSAFENRAGSSFLVNEAALAHPPLPNAELLVAALEKLRDSPDACLSGAAKEVLRHYEVRVQLGETDLP